MNFLAHLWIADATRTSPAGAILGDVVRGSELGDFPADIALGIRLHRHIDAATDRHPRLLQARAGFPEGSRRYAGILLDLLIDHAMTQRWSAFSGEPLDGFAQRSAVAVAAAAPWFTVSGSRPPRSTEFTELLLSYAAEAGIDHAIHRVASRMRRPDPLLEAAQGWQAHAAALTEDLPSLLAELRQQALAFRDAQAS